MEGTTFNLVAFLSWIVNGAGAGTLAYLLMNWFKWEKWWPQAGSETKRDISIVATIVIACLAWLFLVAIGAIEHPGVWWEWIEDLASVAGPAYIVASKIHGLTDLRIKDREATKAEIARKQSFMGTERR